MIDEFDRARVERFEQERARALQVVDGIVKRGNRHFEAFGNEPMAEVTDEWLQHNQNRIQSCDDIIADIRSR